VINETMWRCGENYKKKKISEVKWSELNESEVNGSTLWCGCAGYVGAVKWTEGKVMVKCKCNMSWHYALITVTV
jgi:hypothetical protein